MNAMKAMNATRTEPILRGRRVLVTSRRDVGHPEADDREQYLHEITRRWVAAGTRVVWASTRPPGLPARTVIDGVEVVRSRTPGGHRRTVRRLLRQGTHSDGRDDLDRHDDLNGFDVVIETTGPRGGGPAPATPLIVGRRVPVVRVAHHVPRRSAGPFIRGGHWGNGGGGDRAIVALSPAARHALRRHLGLRGPVFVVPPGAPGPIGGGGRAAEPTIVVETRLIPEARIDLLLRELTQVVRQVPRLRVEILGDGPELPRLRRITHDAYGPAGTYGTSGTSGTPGTLTVTLHGKVSVAERDAWLRRAWLTVSTAATEMCGCPALRAAAYGVPCLAVDGPGARAFVRDGRTGQVIDAPDGLGQAIVRRLRLLADDDYARRTADSCRAWADRFQWDRSARLLAGVVEHQIRTHRPGRLGLTQRRYARSDITTLVRFADSAQTSDDLLRVTDEVTVADGVVSALLAGCDEFDALGVLGRLSVEDAHVRLAGHDDLLAGPHPLPASLTGPPGTSANTTTYHITSQPRPAAGTGAPFAGT